MHTISTLKFLTTTKMLLLCLPILSLLLLLSYHQVSSNSNSKSNFFKVSDLFKFITLDNRYQQKRVLKNYQTTRKSYESEDNDMEHSNNNQISVKEPRSPEKQMPRLPPYQTPNFYENLEPFCFSGRLYSDFYSSDQYRDFKFHSKSKLASKNSPFSPREMNINEDAWQSETYDYSFLDDEIDELEDEEASNQNQNLADSLKQNLAETNSFLNPSDTRQPISYSKKIKTDDDNSLHHKNFEVYDVNQPGLENQDDGEANLSSLSHESDSLEDRYSDIRDELNNIKNGAYDKIHENIDLHQINYNIFTLPEPFNFSNYSLLVYLHMQKTGGTSFGQHLVDNLQKCVKIKGYKRRDCQRNLDPELLKHNTPGNTNPNYLEKSRSLQVWIISRLSTGWICGLHSDFTEMKNCLSSDKIIDKIKGEDMSRDEFRELVDQHYVTNLRNPEDRYVSEWRHVVRGATWKQSFLRFGA